MRSRRTTLLLASAVGATRARPAARRPCGIPGDHSRRGQLRAAAGPALRWLHGRRRDDAHALRDLDCAAPATDESTACNLGGITVPFSDAELHELYPTFGDYQSKVRRATDVAVRRGWLLRRDAVDQMQRVCDIRTRYAEGDRGRRRAYTPPPIGG